MTVYVIFLVVKSLVSTFIFIRRRVLANVNFLQHQISYIRRCDSIEHEASNKTAYNCYPIVLIYQISLRNDIPITFLVYKVSYDMILRKNIIVIYICLFVNNIFAWLLIRGYLKILLEFDRINKEEEKKN